MITQENTLTVWSLQVVYKATLELYNTWFNKLELALKYANKNQAKKIEKMLHLTENYMQTDMDFFIKALEMGIENLDQVEGELKAPYLAKELQQVV